MDTTVLHIVLGYMDNPVVSLLQNCGLAITDLCSREKRERSLFSLSLFWQVSNFIHVISVKAV